MIHCIALFALAHHNIILLSQTQLLTSPAHIGRIKSELANSVLGSFNNKVAAITIG